MQEQIKGVKGPKYKKFAKRAEAEEYVRTLGKSSTVTATKTQPDAEEPNSKKARTSTDAAAAAVTTSGRKVVKVYTDGSSRGNGRLGAFAGFGVFFGDGDPRYVVSLEIGLRMLIAISRNVSERLEGDLQTNQRAELTAIQRALEIVPKDHDIQIVTDSNYAINCCSVWYKSWVKNDWKTSVGGPVLNKDIVFAVRELMDERTENGSSTSFQWIKGHSADPGNEAADKLAVAGAFAGQS